MTHNARDNTGSARPAASDGIDPTQARSATDPAADTGSLTSDPARWLELHGDAMFRFAMLRSGSRELAEEAVQDAFLAALSARSSFDGRSSERTWLIGILRYKLIDLIRKRRKDSERTVGTAPESESLFDQGIWIRRPKNWNSVDVDLESEDFQRVLADCIKRLPSPMREAFCLRVLDDVPTDEVCKSLGIRTTNLWTLVHRAKLRLRSCLTKKWFGGEDS